MKAPQRTAWILIGLSLCALVAGALIWQMTAPNTISVEYRTGNGEWKEAALPFELQRKNDTFQLRWKFSLPKLHPSLFTFGADDCIESITANDAVPAWEERKGCNVIAHPLAVRLDMLMHPGENIITVSVRDKGGASGTYIRPSFWDPLRALPLALFAGAVLLLIFGIARLLQKKIPTVPATLLLIALGVRLMLIPHPGLQSDQSINAGWIRNGAAFGLVRGYVDELPYSYAFNYPPLSMLTYSSLGKIYALLIPENGRDTMILRFLFKLPSIVADLCLLVLFGWLGKKWKNERWGTAMMLVIALHPILLYDGAMWGQTDVVFTLLSFAAITSALFKKWKTSGAMMALALLMKAQAVALLPLWIVLWLLAKKLEKKQSFIAGVVAVVVVLLPFVLAGLLPKIWSVYTESVGFWPSVTIQADNMWGIFYAYKNQDDLKPFIGSITYQQVGTMLFVLYTVVFLWVQRTALAKSLKDPLRYGHWCLCAGGLVAWSFFFFNTEMHERYFFPAAVFLLPLVFSGNWGIALYVVIAVAFWENLARVVPMGMWDRELIGLIPRVKTVMSVVQLILFALTTGFVIRNSKTPLKR